MERELGSKLAKVAEEFDSAGLLIAKDRAGPIFLTHQTDLMFILTAHLKGYKRNNIKIEINEDGSKITISGEKQIQETLMVGRKVIKKDVELIGFRKTFKIPQIVVLDKIKARFNEDESKLTIRMPKSSKGIVEATIEELKDDEFPKNHMNSLQVHDNGEPSEQENDKKIPQSQSQSQSQDNQENKDKHVQDVTENAQNSTPFEKGLKNEKISENCEEEKKPEQKQDRTDEIGKEKDVQEPKSPTKKLKICTPIIAGSALFASLIVLVFHLIHSKTRSNKKKD